MCSHNDTNPHNSPDLEMGDYNNAVHEPSGHASLGKAWHARFFCMGSDANRLVINTLKTVLFVGVFVLGLMSVSPIEMRRRLVLSEAEKKIIERLLAMPWFKERTCLDDCELDPKELEEFEVFWKANVLKHVDEVVEAEFSDLWEDLKQYPALKDTFKKPLDMMQEELKKTLCKGLKQGEDMEESFKTIWANWIGWLDTQPLGLTPEKHALCELLFMAKHKGIGIRLEEYDSEFVNGRPIDDRFWEIDGKRFAIMPKDRDSTMDAWLYKRKRTTTATQFDDQDEEQQLLREVQIEFFFERHTQVRDRIEVSWKAHREKQAREQQQSEFEGMFDEADYSGGNTGGLDAWDTPLKLDKYVTKK